MTLDQLLPPAQVFDALKASAKPALLRDLCRLAAERIAIDAATLSDAVTARENLGSTGVGGGIALPHARLAALSAPTGFLARLAKPVDFAAIDGGKVDIVFLLLSPLGDTASHLAALALAARRLRDPAVAAALRRAEDAAALRAAFLGAG
jgi:PTS system nitrogen regulatory IIA component